MSIRPLKKVLLALKKAEWAEKLRIKVRVLKESIELLACPGFGQPALVPVLVRGDNKETPQLVLDREFGDFHVEIYLSLDEDQTVAMELKLNDREGGGRLPNRFQLMKNENLLESLDLDEPELYLDHLEQGCYNFEFFLGDQNLGSFALDLE